MPVPTQSNKKTLARAHHLNLHKSASLMACLLPSILWASTAGFASHWLYLWFQGGLSAGQATSASTLLAFFLAMLLVSLLGFAASVLIYLKRWPLYWQGGMLVLGLMALWCIGGD